MSRLRLKKIHRALISISRSDGIAMVMVLFFLLIALPLSLASYQMVVQLKRAAVHDVKRRNGLEAANSGLMDIMRQLSNDQYAGATSPTGPTASWVYPDLAIGSGKIVFNNVFCSTSASLLIQATGDFGTGQTQTISSLIHFRSDLTRFGTNLADFDISADNVTYLGPMNFNGTLTVDGSNIVMQNGPLIVTQDLQVNGSLTMQNANVFLGRNRTGSGTFSMLGGGTLIPFAPVYTRPTLNLDYYRTHRIYYSTTEKFLQFNWDPISLNATYQDCDATLDCTNYPTNWAPPTNIGPTGGIFYCDNCNIDVSGTIARPITVVAGGPPGDPAKGNINVYFGTVYPANATFASPTYSLALLAKNTIKVDRKTTGDVTVVGVLYQEIGNADNTITIKGFNATAYNFSGTRTSGFKILGAYDGGGSFSNGSTLTYDQNLGLYPPPGLPVRPDMVTWNIN